MAHGEEEGGGSDERWLVSYSDFITLLMVMFVVLYSMGQIDVAKYRRLADSMRAAFSIGGAASKVVDANINQEGGSSDDGEPNPIVVPGIPKQAPASQEVAGQLTSLLANSHIGGEVSVQTNIEGVLISLGEKLVFKPGTAELQADGYPVLDTIAQMLAPIDRTVKVVGHTDNSQPTDSRYNNNWELSLGRAMVIADYLMAHGVAPERLIISGRGEYEPIFPNDTQKHRSLNSRAEIIVVYNVENSVIGTGLSSIDPPLDTSSTDSTGEATGSSETTTSSETTPNGQP